MIGKTDRWVDGLKKAREDGWMEGLGGRMSEKSGTVQYIWTVVRRDR